jgi:hypothetical protein
MHQHKIPDPAQQFQNDGFFVLESVTSDDEISALRDECQRFIDKRDREMATAGTEVLGLDQRVLRYFVNDCSVDSGRVARLSSWLPSDAVGY